MTMNDFQYLPLNTYEPSFRLLRLRKGDTTPVQCEIFHDLISEHDTAPYEALSYAWGCADLVDYIEVNGARLWITENLHSALQCLQSRDQDRVLWIDAICIDQSNKVERSEQVQQMGSIFGFARRVIFWLGKPTVEAMLLMGSLSELYIKSIAVLRQNSKADITVWKKLWSDVLPTLESERDNITSRQRTGLRILLRRPWFDRVWIIQEVAMAQSAIVCSGIWSLPAHIFALSPKLLDLDLDPRVHSVLDLMPGLSPKTCREHREDRLINLLHKFRTSKATDERDMVFALLGVSCEPSDHALLRPDYTKPIQKVIHDTISYWFESTAVTIRQVLHFLAGLQTVQALCLVPAGNTETAKESIHLSIGKTLVTIRNLLKSYKGLFNV
jgi:hypothetical protein